MTHPYAGGQPIWEYEQDIQPYHIQGVPGTRTPSTNEYVGTILLSLPTSRDCRGMDMGAHRTEELGSEE